MFARSRKQISVVLFPILLLGIFCLVPLPVQSQDAEKSDDRPAVKEKPKKESPKKGLTHDLEGDLFLTQDKVRLSATYYYGNADKETVPVLLLHGDKGSRKDFAPLIDLLINNGYAVLAADLRGHGRSVKRYEYKPPKFDIQMVSKNQNSSGGGRGQKPKYVPMQVLKEPASTKLIDYLAEEFQQEDYSRMVYDVLFLRETLERVHAEGMVNLNRLVVVGVGRGAALAAWGTVQDWKDKDSDRFTKTLVMIAPTELDPRFDMPRAFSNNKWMRTNLAVLFAVPNNDVSGQGIAEKIRAALLEKNEDEKLEAHFEIVNYPTTKTVKTDKEESKTEMTIAETFSSGEAKLGKTVFNFIDNRNKAFTEKEARWSKLK
ncbi:MAG: alpha/beta fold hydrolase [Planctomycetaceae bacterium]|jgi:pimeloyl-ACP methyl ester carboxylesterase|nr:alpha/beta fold hydrolase [Planctomycetaceae bacterium]